jgi:hypothetical protein
MGVLIRKFSALHGLSIQPRFYEFSGGQGLLDVGRVLNSIRAYRLVDARIAAALVCPDIDCRTADELRADQELVTKELAKASPEVPIRYHFVRFALETWLAADHAAWERKYPRAGPHVLPHDILTDCDPKSAIEQHLRARGEFYRYTQHDRQIAELMDVSSAGQNCPNLLEFLTKL